MAAQSKLESEPVANFLRQYAEFAKLRYKESSDTTKLLSTIAFTASIVSASYGGYKWWSRSRTEAETGRILLRRNSGIRGKDGKRIIYVPSGDRTAKVEITSTKSTTFDAHRRLFLQAPRTTGLSDGQYPQVPPPQTRPGLNLAFLHQFLALMSIAVPRLASHESFLLSAHAVALIVRTYLSLVVARLDGAIVRDLVAGNGRSFLLGVLKWFIIGAGASCTNATIKYYQSKVSIAFRTRLTRYIHDLYLNDHLNYYKLITTDGGVGLQADQFITQGMLSIRFVWKPN
jgi:ATP-binding cassette subfamily D (ALD) long-chain fatty acid import protein